LSTLRRKKPRMRMDPKCQIKKNAKAALDKARKYKEQKKKEKNNGNNA